MPCLRTQYTDFRGGLRSLTYPMEKNNAFTMKFLFLLPVPFQIRLYPRVSNLDNAFASITKVPSQILLVNVFKDLLIIFCADYHISLYSIERREYPTTSECSNCRIGCHFGGEKKPRWLPFDACFFFFFFFCKRF